MLCFYLGNCKHNFFLLYIRDVEKSLVYSVSENLNYLYNVIQKLILSNNLQQQAFREIERSFLKMSSLKKDYPDWIFIVPTN